MVAKSVALTDGTCCNDNIKVKIWAYADVAELVLSGEQTNPVCDSQFKISETLGPRCFFFSSLLGGCLHPYALVRFHARVGISGTADWADGSCCHWRLGCAIVSV